MQVGITVLLNFFVTVFEEVIYCIFLCSSAIIRC